MDVLVSGVTRRVLLLPFVFSLSFFSLSISSLFCASPLLTHSCLQPHHSPHTRTYTMVSHNNALPNVHLRKHWERIGVRTHLNQAGAKKSRRDAREKKRIAAGTRPLGLLRPAVRGQTFKYNTKVRLGRGFTLEELKVRREEEE